MLADSPGTVGGQKAALMTSTPGIYRPIKREADLGSIVDEGTQIGELLDPLTSDVIESFYAPYPRTALALLRPTMARIESVGQVVAMVGEVS